MSRTLYFVTGNANKLREVRDTIAELAPSIDVQAITIDLPEIQGTMREIAMAKATAARADPGSRYPLIIEDTSLVFSALKQGSGEGLPGPYIKWFLENMSTAAIARLLDVYADKSAEFQCSIVYLISAEATPILFVGVTPGTIHLPVTTSGFGWDNIFTPIGSTVSYAEMRPEHKRATSARTRALEQLVRGLH